MTQGRKAIEDTRPEPRRPDRRPVRWSCEARDREEELLGYPARRNLDGIVCATTRGGKDAYACLTDLTEGEREMALMGKDEEWLRGAVEVLAGQLRAMGDALEVFRAPAETPEERVRREKIERQFALARFKLRMRDGA